MVLSVFFPFLVDEETFSDATQISFEPLIKQHLELPNCKKCLTMVFVLSVTCTVLHTP